MRLYPRLPKIWHGNFSAITCFCASPIKKQKSLKKLIIGGKIGKFLTQCLYKFREKTQTHNTNTMLLNHSNNHEVASSRLMTVKDLAAYLSLDTTTIYRMVERGEIPVVRIGQRGRTVRFKRDAVELWLKTREMNQVSPAS